ncbi:MAG: transcription termination/antitermination protein NusG [Eubacteriales bacterium]|nr:transcription termination/antitermination protein NusG [Eubacteriales bacterium]
MSDAAKWYVVHTYSGYENKVASSIEKAVENRKLHDLIPAVNIPTETVTEIKDGKSRQVERKLFPGYVLVKMVMTDETWYLVRNTRGCTGFVGQDKSGGSRPIPLTEAEIAAMGVEKREIEVDYGVGDSIRVIDGPLAGFIGVVSAVEPDKDRVDVTVSMFGRETPVELTLDQVEPLDE